MKLQGPFVCVRMCAYVCACVRACVRACVWESFEQKNLTHPTQGGLVGHKIKSPGNVMNSPENIFLIFNPHSTAGGGVKVLGVKILKDREIS